MTNTGEPPNDAQREERLPRPSDSSALLAARLKAPDELKFLSILCVSVCIYLISRRGPGQCTKMRGVMDKTVGCDRHRQHFGQ